MNLHSVKAQETIDSASVNLRSVPVQRMAMYPYAYSNIGDKIGAKLESRIRTIINQNGNYFLFSDDQIREFLQSQNLSTQESCIKVDCLSTFGSNTGSDFTIGGEIKLLPNGYHFSLNLVGTAQKRQMNFVSKLLTDDWEQLLSAELPDLINKLLETPKFVKSGSLTVESDADSAIVYIDGILVGKTPYTNSEMSFGDHSIRVVNTAEFKEKIEKITITPEDPSLTVIANFRFKLGKLYISGLPYGANLTMNEIRIGDIPYKDENVFWGEYNIVAKHIGYYDRELTTTILSYKPKHVELVLKYKNRYLAMFYSALLPGWGQAYSGHYKRATVFPIIYASGILASLFMNQQYSEALKTYEEKRDIYKAEILLLSGPIGDSRTNMDLALDDAENKRLIGLSAVAATTLFWFYNLNDALLGFPPRIRDPWESEKARFPALSYSITNNALFLTMNTEF